MDTQDYFAGVTLVDTTSGEVQRNATLQAFLPSDTGFTDPLTVTDTKSGAVLNPFTTSGAGRVQDFRVAGEPSHVVLKSGSFTVRMSSVIGSVMDAGLGPEVVEVVLEAALASSSDAAEYASEAEQARDDARAIATADVATAWGFYPILSDTPPTQTTMDGVPVVWLDPASYEAPIVVLPPAPAWDDAASRFTVPSNVVGCDYVWTSGGGGVGATLSPGATLSTTGSYPRTVTIAPVPKPGYVLAAGVRDFVHDFSDPAALTLMVSDGFSGGAATGITGRVPDNALGGSLTGAWTTGAAWNVDGSGHAVSSGSGDIAMLPLTPGWKNVRAEVNVTSMAGTAKQPFNLAIVDRQTGGSVTLALDSTRAGLIVSNGRGGSVWPTAPADAIVPGPGLWTLQIYGTTATIIDPKGNTRVYDLSDTSAYRTGAETGNAKSLWLRNSSSTSSFTVDSVKVSKVGF